jgi:osmotically inducible protein OsmC
LERRLRGAVTFTSRFEQGEGTNPEELIAAAHAGCFSMQFAALLTQAGHEPESVDTTAKVHLDKDDGGLSITRSELTTEAKVEGVSEDEFQQIADGQAHLSRLESARRDRRRIGGEARLARG